jgi:predicted transcriptional regulator
LIVPKRRTEMLFFAMVKFKTQLSKEVVEKNMKNIGAESSEISRVLKALANAGLIAKHPRESESIGNTGA